MIAGDGAPLDWDELYAELVTATGWEWEYIDEYMTIPRLLAMRRYWDIAPPTHIQFMRLNSALLTEKGGRPEKQSNGDLNDFIRDFIGQGGVIAGVDNV